MRTKLTLRHLVALLAVLVAVLACGIDSQGAAAASTSGRWTAHSLTITPHHLGAVSVGMTPKQAGRAAGVRLSTQGDGEYSSRKAPGLVLATGFGPSCVVAYSPAHVRTSAGIHIGSTLHAVRKAYSHRLHYHSGPSGYSDPDSYYVRSGNRYLFFHLSGDRTGTVWKLASGANLHAAYC